MARKVCTIFILFLITSCHQLTDDEKTEIIHSTRQMLENYQNDVRQSGLMAELKYLDNSAEFYWVPPGYSEELTIEKVTEILNANAPRYTSVDNKFETLEIIPITEQLASYSGRICSATVDTAGAATTLTFSESGLLVKRADGWKLLNGQTTAVNR